MKLQLTFNDVCGMLKKQGPQEAKVVEAIDVLLGMALICSPAVFGPAAIAVLPTLAAKNEITKHGKWLFDFIMRRKEVEYLKRYETMQTAYSLLVFTSFFAVVDARIPKPFRKKLERDADSRPALATKAMRDAKEPETGAADAPLANVPVEFPHPTETMAQQVQRHAPLWKQMRDGLVEFCQKLDLWELLTEKEREAFLKSLEGAEDASGEHFVAQYYELCRKFNDFAIWANLRSHDETKSLISDLSDYVRSYTAMSDRKHIDVGFRELNELVLKLPEVTRSDESKRIADSLRKSYDDKVNKPIIEDKESLDDSEVTLQFPTVSSAFVPQSFRVLRYKGPSHRLEDDASWHQATRREDLGTFLLNYLSSPYSTESPLLVLGHPGSGKSLLTTVLAAQLMSSQFTVIRVPLREVDADAEIHTQIEQGIRRITGVGVESWVRLSTQFVEYPPLVILDGYDELLQASGQVFASYIREAQRFQHEQTVQGRPLRIIVTSRITLIDKAAIPSGATVIRLLEFDKAQRDRWSDIWNRENAHYFNVAGVEPFALPDERESGAEKILALAEQPLLLLMLALYDSSSNELRKSKGLDRTKLYDSLLRRFVERELLKNEGFRDRPVKQKAASVDREMLRLGVAALGMFNRRELHILSPQLDDDLAFFQLQRENPAGAGRALTQADLLFGSFFFVHKSMAQCDTEDDDSHDEAAAFEFLHNTFGEFLTADFILRQVVQQVEALRALESASALAAELERMLSTADGLGIYWFTSLIYTPLFTRPVIMEMIREWTPHVLRRRKIPAAAFVTNVETLVLNQISRLLSKRDMPSILKSDVPQEGLRVPFGERPLVSYLAVYSINLVLLRIVIGAQHFTFNEGEIAAQEGENRPWDRLIHIWQSWFAPLNLAGLNAIMRSRRNGAVITVEAMPKFEEGQAPDRLTQSVNIARAIGDDVGYCLAALLAFDTSRASIVELDDMASRVEAERLALDLPLGIKRLQMLLNSPQLSVEEFIWEGVRSLRRARRAERMGETEQLSLIFAQGLSRLSGLLEDDRGSIWERQARGLPLDPREAVELALAYPQVGRGLMRIVHSVFSREWRTEFFDRVSMELLHRFEIQESGESLELLREALAHVPDHRLHQELVDRLLDPRRFLEMGRSPRRSLLYLEAVEALGFLDRFTDQVAHFLSRPDLPRLFDPDDVLALFQADRTRGLTYLALLWQLGAHEAFEDLRNALRRFVIPRLIRPSIFAEFLKREPGRAWMLISLLREAKLDRAAQRKFSDKDWEREFDHTWRHGFVRGRTSSSLKHDQLLFAVWLAFARLAQSLGLAHQLVDMLLKWRGRAIADSEQLFRAMPLLSISDLKWAASVTGNDELRAVIAQLMMDEDDDEGLRLRSHIEQIQKKGRGS